MGDLNLPNIDWETPDATQELSIVNQQACSDLLEFMNKNFLSQMILKPTRKDNIIDLVFTNKHQDIVETNIRETQVSDHRLVELLLGYNPLSPKKRHRIIT